MCHKLGRGTGLRWGELVRARASDVQRGMLVVSHTKSAKVRRVPLPADLLEELRFKIGALVPIRIRGVSRCRCGNIQA